MCTTAAMSSTTTVAALAASQPQLGASTHARISYLLPDLSESWFERLGGSLWFSQRKNSSMSASGRDCKDKKSLVMRQEFLWALPALVPLWTGWLAKVRTFWRFRVLVIGEVACSVVCDTNSACKSLPRFCSWIRDLTTSYSMTSCVCSATRSLLLLKGLPSCSTTSTNARTLVRNLVCKALASSWWVVFEVVGSSTVSNSLMHTSYTSCSIGRTLDGMVYVRHAMINRPPVNLIKTLQKILFVVTRHIVLPNF